MSSSRQDFDSGFRVNEQKESPYQCHYMIIPHNIPQSPVPFIQAPITLNPKSLSSGLLADPGSYQLPERSLRFFSRGGHAKCQVVSA